MGYRLLKFFLIITFLIVFLVIVLDNFDIISLPLHGNIKTFLKILVLSFILYDFPNWLPYAISRRITPPVHLAIVSFGVAIIALSLYIINLDKYSGNKFILVGILIFFIPGLCILISNYLKNKRREYLKRDGIKIIGKFKNLVENRIVSTMGVYPFRIICTARSPFTKKEENFISGNVWLTSSLSNKLKGMKELNFKIYFHPDDPKKYYIDVEKVLKL